MGKTFLFQVWNVVVFKHYYSLKSKIEGFFFPAGLLYKHFRIEQNAFYKQ